MPEPTSTDIKIPAPSPIETDCDAPVRVFFVVNLKFPRDVAKPEFSVWVISKELSCQE
jgi:hypothetical protein